MNPTTAAIRITSTTIRSPCRPCLAPISAAPAIPSTGFSRDREGGRRARRLFGACEVRACRTLEVRPHADLFALSQGVEECEETGKSCVSDLITQLGVDFARRLSLGREVGEATGGERDALLPATAGRIGDQDIATLPEMGNDLAGALSGDPEFSPDRRDCRSAGLRTESKDAAVREPPVIEAGVGHSRVESKLVANPRTPQGGAETDRARARRLRHRPPMAFLRRARQELYRNVNLVDNHHPSIASGDRGGDVREL